MFIVFEGPDGVGKTTLAEDVLDVVGGVITHFGPPKQHAWAEYGAPLGEIKTTFDEPYGEREPGSRCCLFDRYHWGELVYGPLFRGATELGTDGFHSINRAIANLGGLLVLVTAPVDVKMARLAERGDEETEYEDPSKQSQIHAAFDQLFTQARQQDGVEPHLLRIDTSRTDRRENTYMVIEAAAKAYIRRRHADKA